jgi:hypothetical protein
MMEGEATATTEEISLSIEETNRLRISLGLKPLNETKGAKKDQIAAQNFANEKKRLAKRAERYISHIPHRHTHTHTAWR